MNRLRLLVFLLSLLLGGTALAQAGPRHMQVRLVSETAAVAAGSSVTLAFVMHPEPGWHGYWRNPGDAGDAPRVRWRLSEGWRAGPLQYPMPTRLVVAGLMNYVFARDYALLVRIEVPAAAEPGAAFPIDAHLDYLVCTDEVCVPESATVSTQVNIGAPHDPDPAFNGYRQAIPGQAASPARFAAAGGRIRIALPLPAGMAIDSAYFFPATPDALAHAAPQSISRRGDLVIVETAAGPRAGALLTVEGVLQLADGRSLAFTARPGVVPGPAPRDEGSGILWALLGALLGGLILNVMPCVFPILSLKALSLARAGETARGARREALAYAGGVVVTCLALGGLLLALRASGAAVGWAFQLQDPRVILLLLLLTAAIALGLAGLFQLPMIAAGDRLTRGEGLGGAFFTGALAAFVATPCTGPFMAGALGAALLLSPAGALAVFAGLGLGLALPFLLLGFVPALRRLLPRPGRWMATFQRLLSLPMFLTALGLAWILGRQTGVDGMSIGLGAALLVGLCLWWLGNGGRWLAWLALIAAVAVPPALLPTKTPASARAEGPLAAAPFSEARLAALRRAGTPVFVYFTADWCLTCKVNERGAMASAEVAAAFRAHGVKVLVGDWTRGDPAIGRFLEQHRRSGVPFYLFYPRGGGEPETLPQILTANRLAALGG